MTVFSNNSAYIECTPDDLHLQHTLESGQTYRWKPLADGLYEGVVRGKKVAVSQNSEGIRIFPCIPEEYPMWADYFDLETDYAAYCRVLSQDDVIAPMLQPCRGMHILNQEIWECLISFILSANNNIRRISGIVERLSDAFGHDLGGRSSFPAPEALAAAGVEAIRNCGAGYRAPYVYEAALRVCQGYDVSRLPGIGYEQAKKELMQFKGIGEKVADCILLYSCRYGNSFPVDTWVAKAMKKYYPDLGENRRTIGLYARERYGGLSGLAQQYIFHYERILESEG